MYEAHWGLKERPFENVPNPKYFFLTAQHEEALARLTYAITERKGAALLTGVFGCGKTLVGQTLVGRLHAEQHRVAVLSVPPATHQDLFRGIVRRLRGTSLPANPLELSTDALIGMLEDTLRENDREGKNVVVIVDEAHTIKQDEVFDGLRMLLNFHTAQGFQLTLLLLGQPELEQLIDDRKPLEQRIGIKARLSPMTMEEMRGYIAHRAGVAGAATPLFDAGALELIYQASGGIPRRVNRLCDMCLLSGFGKRARIVTRDIVQEELTVSPAAQER